MTRIDPLSDFTNPDITKVLTIPYGDGFVSAGIAEIRGRTYAIPVVWNIEDSLWDVIEVDTMLQYRAVGIDLWSKIGIELRQPDRDEIFYVLIAGVANLPHPPL